MTIIANLGPWERIKPLKKVPCSGGVSAWRGSVVNIPSSLQPASDGGVRLDLFGASGLAWGRRVPSVGWLQRIFLGAGCCGVWAVLVEA